MSAAEFAPASSAAAMEVLVLFADDLPPLADGPRWAAARSPDRWPLGAALVLSGFALARSFVAAFHRADTAVDPRRPTTVIVTTGPYRLTRNPGYLGMTLVYAGIAALSGALGRSPPSCLRRPHGPRGYRPRGAVPGVEVRRGIRGLQAPAAAGWEPADPVASVPGVVGRANF